MDDEVNIKLKKGEDSLSIPFWKTPCLLSPHYTQACILLCILYIMFLCPAESSLDSEPIHLCYKFSETLWISAILPAYL